MIRSRGSAAADTAQRGCGRRSVDTFRSTVDDMAYLPLSYWGMLGTG